jgi:uncharacterized protein YigA (DUF484 family)
MTTTRDSVRDNITGEAVASYLQEHPEFFEAHADLIADIHIPHPHGGRAIPISERQILTLRERARQLEQKLREVIRYGEENDAIGEKVHRLTVALLSAREPSMLVAAITFNLREDFAIPHVALRVCGAGGAVEAAAGATPSEAVRDYAVNLASPYCGSHPPAQVVADLFGETAVQLKSFSMIPLRSGEMNGVLALASEDAQRFYPEMGTVYLRRIGDLVATALSRELP